MVSHPEVNRRLRQFVCVRMDWEQMQRYQDRWASPTQGNQVVLDSEGRYLSGTPRNGERYPIPALLALLDRALQEHGVDPERPPSLKLEWFLWNPQDQGLPGHFNAEFISRLDRKPVLVLSGPPPAWVESESFLRRHLRQFIFTRGARQGPPTLTVRQLEPQSRELLRLSLASAKPEEVGRKLDEAWLEYMKQRPMTARGYIDNPHGTWLKPVLEPVHQEELALREAALSGALTPPGRGAGEETGGGRNR